MPSGGGENNYMRLLVVSVLGILQTKWYRKKDRKYTDPTTTKKTILSQQRLSQHTHLVKSLVCDGVLNGMYFFVEFVPQQVFEWKWIRRRGNTARTWEKEKWKASRKVQPLTSGVEPQIKMVPVEKTFFTIDISSSCLSILRNKTFDTLT